jgi:spore coat polysaccharide biosynthesis protein SpsF (cytidylyltransferase family)
MVCAGASRPGRGEVIPPLCIVQARMGSKRLPGKMLLRIKGRALIEIAWSNAVGIFGRENVVVAFPKTLENLPLSMFLANLGSQQFEYEGDEDDVLGRYFHCASEYRNDPNALIHRWTPDDPFKSPEVVGYVLHGERWPVELGGEAFTFKQLTLAHATVRDAFRREHISFALFESPAPPPPPGLWTIDTVADYEAANAA